MVIGNLGHYVGSLKRRAELLNSGLYYAIFIMIADAHALTDNGDNPEKILQNISEALLVKRTMKTNYFENMMSINK